MLEKPEINLLNAFCTLPFGASKSKAVEIFGDPEEIQHLTDDILNTSTLAHHYWNQGYSLFFDTNNDACFCSAEISHKETRLFGIKIFNLKEQELIALMKQNGYTLSDSEMHTWGEKRLSFDEAELDCYFEKGKLLSVNMTRPNGA